MATLDIIKFTTDGITVDGYVELTKRNGSSLITVRTCKDVLDNSNQNLLYKFITNNFAEISFDHITTSCSLVYKEGKNKDSIKSTISFDSNSSSAYLQFKKTFTEMTNTKYETEYYPSGRVMYVGEILYKEMNENIRERVPNGSGTIYYDVPGYKIKYTGEFEGGLYDGAGTFYNLDNKISLTANNISSGIPTQKAKLNINYSKKKESINIVFNDIWLKFNLTDKLTKMNIVLSNEFVTDLAKLYWSPQDITMDALVFYDKSLDDKYFELWLLINRNSLSIEKINKNIEEKYTETVAMLSRMCSFIILLMILIIFNILFFI